MCAGRGGLFDTSDSSVEFTVPAGRACRRTQVVCNEVSSSWSRAVASPTLSFTLIYKTAVFLSGISHIVGLSKVPGSWAAHPVHVKAKTCGQKR